MSSSLDSQSVPPPVERTGRKAHRAPIALFLTEHRVTTTYDSLDILQPAFQRDDLEGISPRDHYSTNKGFLNGHGQAERESSCFSRGRRSLGSWHGRSPSSKAAAKPAISRIQHGVNELGSTVEKPRRDGRDSKANGASMSIAVERDGPVSHRVRQESRPSAAAFHPRAAPWSSGTGTGVCVSAEKRLGPQNSLGSQTSGRAAHGLRPCRPAPQQGFHRQSF